MQKLTLIKLGGSIITDKEKPLTPRLETISSICSALNELKGPTVLVHGGGSFGHYWSVKYDMHTAPKNYDPQGISIVHDSMLKLNQIIVSSLMDHGALPYSIQPSAFARGLNPLVSRVRDLSRIAKRLIPVTFGDVVHVEGTRYSILSGDAIMTMLARVLKPNRVIFATNVDGVLKYDRSPEVIDFIRVKAPKARYEISKSNGADVTGGMTRKIKEATEIAKLGIDVHILNGLHPERLVAAAQGEPVIGTVISRRGPAH